MLRKNISTILILIFFIYSFSCVTVDSSGRVKSQRRKQKKNEEKRQRENRKKWRLSEYSLQDRWREEEKKVPFLYAQVPDKVPSFYQLPTRIKIGNQGRQTSGTAWALGYFTMTYIHKAKQKVRKKEKQKSYTCSPAFIYNKLNNGQNIGIDLLDALKFVLEKGCPEIEYMPYRKDDYSFLPNNRTISNAYKYRIKGFARVDFRDIDQIRAYLLQDKPIVITMAVSSNFITLRSSVWRQPVGRFLGNHSTVIIGYDDKKELLHFQNSVGTRWGGKGYFYMPYSWFIRLTKQAYVIW